MINANVIRKQQFDDVPEDESAVDVVLLLFIHIVDHDRSGGNSIVVVFGVY